MALSSLRALSYGTAHKRPTENLKGLTNIRFATTNKTVFVGFILKKTSGIDLPAHERGGSPASQSLTAAVKGGYFPGAAAGSRIWDLPWQRQGSSHLPVAQPG